MRFGRGGGQGGTDQSVVESEEGLEQGRRSAARGKMKRQRGLAAWVHNVEEKPGKTESVFNFKYGPILHICVATARR